MSIIIGRSRKKKRRLTQGSESKDSDVASNKTESKLPSEVVCDTLGAQVVFAVVVFFPWCYVFQVKEESQDRKPKKTIFPYE